MIDDNELTMLIEQVLLRHWS